MDTKFKNLLKKKKFKGLLTGVSGFIGKNILEYLISNNQIVYGLDKNHIDPNYLNKIFLKYNNRKKNLIFLKGNLLNFNFLKKNKIKIDYVLHQAAFSSVPLSIKRPKYVYNNNVKSFSNLLKYCNLINVKKVIYASSSAVYSDVRNTNETTKIKNLKSIYAKTKFENEKIAKFYIENKKMNIIGLRYFNVYGPYCKIKGKNLPVISNWIKSIMYNQNIQLYGSKEQTRDFIYVKDVVKINIAMALSKNLEFIYNVGTGRETKLVNLLTKIKNKIKKYKNTSSEVIILSKRTGDIRNSKANTKRIFHEFNIKNKKLVNLDLGLNKTIKYFLNK